MKIRLSGPEIVKTRVPWTVVQTLGYEWCKPVGTARVFDYVMISCGIGRLVLCRIEQDVESGEIRRVMIRPKELNRADA